MTSLFFILAPATGFEPIPAVLDAATPVLKTGVLPLHHADVWGLIIHQTFI